MENQYSTPEPENITLDKKGFAQNSDEKIDSLKTAEMTNNCN